MGHVDASWARGRRRIGVATVLVLLLALIAGAAPAQADPGLIVTSTSRYVLDSERGEVAGSITMTLRNVTPNVDTGDGGYRYFFYESYGIPLPAETADVVARSNGSRLRVQRKPIVGQPGFRLFEIGFPQLLYGASRTIELTFTLQGQPARADDSTRIGPGYATFAVFGPGDPGNNTVEVVVDADLELDSTARTFVPSERGDGTTVYTTTEDNLAPGFAATMSVRSSTVGEGRPVTVGGVSLQLVPYPNDPEWADFIEDRADQGLPVLAELVGQPWPGDVDRIREDAGSQVRGFDGWYSTSDREIVLGEELNDGILFHELAHAWINYSAVEDRWLSEGLAEFLAEQTTERTGGTFVKPRQVTPGDTEAVPLATWEDSPGFRGSELDAWAYPASYQVISELLGDLDDATLQAVLADVVTAASPWDLPDRRELSGGQLSTTAFLDLIDAHRASAAEGPDTADVYRVWVLDEAAADALAGRAQAHQAFETFAGASPWGAPLGLRRAMASWDFTEAGELTEELADLPAAATALSDLAGSTGTTLAPEVQRDYEDADTPQEYAAVTDEVAAATAALEQYAHAHRLATAERNVLGGIGARVLNVADTIDAAQQNITVRDYAASEAASRLALDRSGSATTVGAALLAGIILAAVVLALLVVVVVRALRRRSHNRPPLPPAAAPEAPDALATTAGAPEPPTRTTTPPPHQ